MKKKLAEKICAALLAGTLAVSMLAGCGAGDTADTGQAPEDGQQETEAGKPDSEGGEESSEAQEAPENQDVVKLTMFSGPSNTPGLVENSWVSKLLAEEVGVQIEVMPPGEGKLEALMAGGELPDIVIFKDNTLLQNAIKADLLVCLDDYADQMPNAQKYMKTAMSFWADTVSPDGKCYNIPNNLGDSAPSQRINVAPSVRWDLYQQLGKPEVKDMWDLLDVLEQMQALEPENESGQKVYAVIGWSDWDADSMSNATFYTTVYGVDSGDKLVSALPYGEADLVTGELGTTLDPESRYVEGLKWFFTANQKGLLDPDSMTQTWNTVVEKTTAGRVLFNFWNWSTGSYNTPDRVNADSPTGFMNLIPSESRIPLDMGLKTGKNWTWAIGKGSKNLDKAIAFLDFMCSPDNAFLLENGPKGELWDLDDAGKPYLTEKGKQVKVDGEILLNDGGKLSDGNQFHNANVFNKGVVSEAYGGMISSADWESYEPIRNKLMDAWTADTGYEETIDLLMDKGYYVGYPDALNMIKPLDNDMQEIATQIGDIVRTQSWLAVYAKDEAEFDAIVNQMIADAKTVGLDTLMEYNKAAWQEAVDRAAQYE